MMDKSLAYRGRIISSPFFICVLLVILLVAASLLSLSIGGSASIFTDDPRVNNAILWKLRFPKLITSILVGASLALSGFVFQNVLKNPLADPYILGISSGAATGMALYITLSASISVLGAQVSSFAGALAALLFLLLLMRRLSGSTTVIVLIGIGLSFFLSSVITFLISGMNGKELVFMNSWLIGNISQPELPDLIFPAIIFVMSVSVVFMLSNVLDALVFGDEFAVSTGINTKIYPLVFVVAASLLTASCVAVCGTIGFVGLVVPHIVRLVIKGRAAKMLPVVLLAGAVFLTLCNAISGALSFNIEIPVGAVTSFTGAPVLIYLIFRRYNVKG
ncbi:MAG: iron ABC transporter permease [Oligoflexia bacterium]|nr:iron ABC transporter permease [Oligoflexia bacterium]